MDIQNNRKFNAYRFTDKLIEALKNNIRNNNFKDEKTREKYKGFVINEKNDLEYGPTGQIVCSPDEREKASNEIYNEYGLGSGMNNLYEKVNRRFLNITRKYIREFLQKQSTYQITTSQPKQTNKKLYSTGVNKTWYIDLLDANPIVKNNKGYRYIMTVVDGFSKFVFLSRLKNKDAKTIVNDLNEICILQANISKSNSF
jgi:hypothetical protein